MAYYKRELQLKRTLKSMERSGYKDFNVIIVDDASDNGLNAMNIRPFMFYDEEETFGDNRSAMIRFAENLMRRKKVEVHNGAKRSWLHIRDGVKILEKLMLSDKARIINVGSPDIYDMKYIAHFICDKIGIIYDDFVVEKELPDKMTLEKIPDLTIQNAIAPIEYDFNIVRGMNIVLYYVEKRLNNGII